MLKRVVSLYTWLLLPYLGLAQVDMNRKVETYATEFNSQDNEAVVNMISNARSSAWMQNNIPLLDVPDSAIEKVYYFRWWSYRKHIKNTPEGIIVTEFIEPVKHAARYNAISCALGHHLYEGRWLRNSDFLKEYVDFWLYHADQGESRPRFHQFSSWLPDALLAYYKVENDKQYILNRIDDLDKDLDEWEQERQLDNGLFWQHDVKDGMEESVSGGRREQNMRPTINSYMYGNAMAMIDLATLANRPDLKSKYAKKAPQFKKQLLDSLWDNNDQFFKTKLQHGELHGAREAIGFIPWYFHIPPDENKYAVAWEQLTDPEGFNAEWGLTTAERREPTFRTRGTGHSCEWDGAIWPFATSQTLRGMANLLADYKNKAGISPRDFYDQVAKYAKSHVFNGKAYIGEYQDEKNGYWLKGDDPRSKFYNHSTYADIIIQDLIGFKAMLGNEFELKPLIPKDSWDYFALQDLRYKGRDVSIYWDKSGNRYHKGKGFLVFVDGKLMSKTNQIENLKIKLK